MYALITFSLKILFLKLVGIDVWKNIPQRNAIRVCLLEHTSPFPFRGIFLGLAVSDLVLLGRELWYCGFTSLYSYTQHHTNWKCSRITSPGAASRFHISPWSIIKYFVNPKSLSLRDFPLCSIPCNEAMIRIIFLLAICTLVEFYFLWAIK